MTRTIRFMETVLRDGQHWGGIFLVMLVIYLISLALARLFPPSKEG